MGKRTEISQLSDSSDPDTLSDEGSSQLERLPTFSFPELDAEIRDSIREYGAVFPKLNFTSPRDAAWALSDSAPLKCSTPADVYVLLKSSDFINHDLDPKLVFEGCDDVGQCGMPYELELVLKKWHNIERSREFRCFAHRKKLIAISQRDLNFYDFLGDAEIRYKIKNCIHAFWSECIKDSWPTDSYIFDVVLTWDLAQCRLVDFNPFHPKTEPLLFTYEELDRLPASEESIFFRIIESRSDLRNNQSAPSHFYNRVPIEVLHLNAEQTAEEWIQVMQNIS